MINPYQKLQSNEVFRDTLLPIEKYPIPKAYCNNKDNVKAIVLGADPSNFSNHGDTNKVSFVFGLENGPNKYFKGPMIGLNALGISLDEVYVQNLIQAYCKFESGNNKHWKEIAKHYIEFLKDELDALDLQRKIPVFLTAEILYHVLLNDRERKHSANDFYSCSVSIPIAPEKNKLQRPLIPLYRYNRGSVNYWLNNPAWAEYTHAVKQYIQSLY